MTSAMDAVGAAIRDAAEVAVLPRFRQLTAAAISEKSPGDWVTDADHECEELLTAALQTIEPGVPVIGEEAAAADPRLLDSAERHERVWVLDPVDGTRSFIDGSPDFATMVALIEDGTTSAAWIWQPVHGQMFSARRGETPLRNGTSLPTLSDVGTSGALRGVLRTHTMPQEIRAHADDGLRQAGLHHTPVAAAGIAYPMLVSGELDYALYWRTLPWDHAPGALLAECARMTVRRLDGTPYRPLDGRRGLLTAANSTVWGAVSHALPEDLPDSSTP